LEGLEFVKRVIDQSRSLDDNAIVIAGWWLPQIETTLNAEQSRVEFVYLLDRNKLEQSLSTGRKIFFLPEMDAYELRIFGVDLRQAGANELMTGAP
ncbi:MAG: hypothetical protein NTW07_10525, partial [candidate division Zixibacteria bacterium]|nr:hypothetical protein [candidate division Zixibacteria bacterium]